MATTATTTVAPAAMGRVSSSAWARDGTGRGIGIGPHRLRAVAGTGIRRRMGITGDRTGTVTVVPPAMRGAVLPMAVTRVVRRALAVVPVAATAAGEPMAAMERMATHTRIAELAG